MKDAHWRELPKLNETIERDRRASHLLSEIQGLILEQSAGSIRTSTG